MSTKMKLPISARIRAIPAMNLIGNLVAVTLTIAYFTLIEPSLADAHVKQGVAHRLYFLILVVVTIWLTVIPINIRVFLPLLRDFKYAFPRGQNGPNPALTYEDLHSLAGRLMKFPVRVGISNLIAWLIAGVILFFLPLVSSEFVAWNYETSHKMFFALAFIGAMTAIIIFFLMEWWIRGILRKLFPLDSLRTIPNAPRINVLIKLLVVSMLIGIVPVSVVSHISIHYINNTELNEGVGVLSRMPVAIGFLLALSVTVGIGLSFLLAQPYPSPV